ncbi:serine/threonine-protein kinase [Dictyobacter formicarum]|uniref:Protein kinase domain-containing protein n=1 Tax=Dictyobacter formicarum TaxID=2778368 RepID=A0ABQ3VED4_9CHLR|nr:serine/threonine-protein kinase [Dictyobacter formicarum]GHO83748.1 hypothetical protein KSZ_17540 [Dictyobacter formicarum]
MAAQQNREGQQFGNYQLDRLLGRGGFAEVYLGHHLRLQRQAAIKILHTNLSEQEIANFQREAQIIAALNHPNIVRVLDFDVQHGIPFLVMDYLPQGTLRQWYPKGTRVPLSEVVTIVKPIADALQYAHNQRLIHRDVKPGNMLIGSRNEVVLSDFGVATIAHSTSSMTTPQSSVGTIPYIAPEQIQAHACAASDQYALGAVVYEWLCGEPPFDGSYTEIFAKHMMTPPPPLRQKVPTLPVEVEQVILRALAKDPNDRFGSIQLFATALQEASASTWQPSQQTVEQTRYAPPVAMHQDPTEVANSNPPVPMNPNVAANRLMPPSATIPPSPAKPTPGQKFSRRTIVIGLASVGVLAAAGGGGALLLDSYLSHLPYVYHGHTDTVRAVAWSPDGTRIVSSDDSSTARVWDAANGEDVYTNKHNPGLVAAVAWSPDGKYIASAGFKVKIWNAVSQASVYTYSKNTDTGFDALAWLPDSQRIASASDQSVQVWDATSGGEVYTYSGHSDNVYAVASSPDGTRIASSGSDKTVQVWNAVDGGDVYTYHGHSNAVFTVAWSPDGKYIASGSGDSTVQVWDATSGESVYTYRGHTKGVDSIAWSPDSERIASGSDDKTVQVWDALSGGNVYTYHGHTDSVFTVAWSPDGKRIASGSPDKTVQVWAV